MSFLRLSSQLINLSKITHISIYEDLYHINITTNKVKGHLFFGSGSLDCEENVVIICKDKNPYDYEILSKWIDNLK